MSLATMLAVLFVRYFLGIIYYLNKVAASFMTIVVCRAWYTQKMRCQFHGRLTHFLSDGSAGYFCAQQKQCRVLVSPLGYAFQSVINVAGFTTGFVYRMLGSSSSRRDLQSFSYLLLAVSCMHVHCIVRSSCIVQEAFNFSHPCHRLHNVYEAVLVMVQSIWLVVSVNLLSLVCICCVRQIQSVAREHPF